MRYPPARASNSKDDRRAGCEGANREKSEYPLTQINLTFQDAARQTLLPAAAAMNETFRAGISGFRGVLEFEFLGRFAGAIGQA